MYSVSLDYQEKIKENNRLFKVIIQIQHSTGVLNLTDKDIALGSLIYTEGSQVGENFTIGGTVASDLSLGIVNNPEYANIDFMGATIVPTIALLLNKEVDGETYFLSAPQPTPFDKAMEEEWEYVTLGRFNIDEVNRQRSTIELKAIDNMINLDIPYSLSKLSYPANLYQIYVDICNVADVNVGTTDFPNKNHVVQNRPDGDLNLRDVLGYVAELAGCFAKFNRNGALELSWYKPTGLTLDPSNRFDFKASDDEVRIKGIMATVGDTAYLAGTDDYAIDLTDNPLLQDGYETVLPNIFNNIRNTVFTPYTSNWQGNPAIQAGDMITQIDRDGKVYETLITKSIYKYRGRSTLEAKGLSELSKGYKGSTNRKIANIVKKVEVEIEDKLTTLEQAQLNATELMANMMGGHLITKEGEIYVANNIELENATEYWKWGLGGFAHYKNVDGEMTLDTAITADGSIVAMLVAANIITADMVQTGLLQSESGNTWINLDNGHFNFNNRMRFDDNGFSIDLTSEDIASIANINIILENENQSIGTDSNGATVGNRIISSKITTFKGATRVGSTIGNLKLIQGDGNTTIPTGGNTGITLGSLNPTDNVDGVVTMNINNGVVLPSNNGYILIPITIDGVIINKKINWSKVKDGSSVIVGTLSNNTHVVPTDSNGDNGNYNGCSTTMTIYNGSTNDTSNWTISAITSGVVGNLSGSSYTVTNMTVDSGYVDLIAKRGGYTDVVMRFNVSKNKRAIDGIKGDDGKDSSSFWLVVDPTIKKVDEQFTPNEINIVAKSQVGDDVLDYSGRFIVSELSVNSTTEQEVYFYGTDPMEFDPLDTNSIVKYTSNKDESVLKYTPSSIDIKAIKVQLCRAGGITTLLDEEKIYVIEDGEDGRNVNIVASNNSFISKSTTNPIPASSYSPSQITLTPHFQNCEYSRWNYSYDGETWYIVTSGNRGLIIEGEKLIINNTSNLYSSNQNFMMFRVRTNYNNVTDIITIPRLYDTISLQSSFKATNENWIAEFSKVLNMDSILESGQTKIDIKGITVSAKDINANITSKLEMLTNSGFSLYSKNANGTLTKNFYVDTTGKIQAKRLVIDGDSVFNGTMSWGNITSKPTILTSANVTTITNNTIKTTNVEATNLKVRSANITGGLTARRVETQNGYGDVQIDMYGNNIYFYNSRGNDIVGSIGTAENIHRDTSLLINSSRYGGWAITTDGYTITSYDPRLSSQMNLNEYTICWDDFGINKDLYVWGRKDGLHSTENYGGRLISAYETTEYYYGDIGSGVINQDGECLIHIDEIFQECVNTNINYHVFTQEYSGRVDSIVKEKSYFTIYGEPNTEFSWEMTAKRKGYEEDRMPILDKNDDMKPSNIIETNSLDLSTEDKYLHKLMGDLLTHDLSELLLK